MAKVQRLEKIYTRVDENGQPTKERTGTPTGDFTFKFKETGNEFNNTVVGTIIPKTIWDSLPLVGKNLIMHGVMQKCGDPAAGETGEDVEEAVTGLCEMILAGNFYAEREKGEARPSLVAEAVWEFKREQAQIQNREVDGKTVEFTVNKAGQEETLADVVARYAGKDGAANRKTAMGIDRVKVILARLREEAAKKRREALEAKSKDAPQADASAL